MYPLEQSNISNLGNTESQSLLRKRSRNGLKESNAWKKKVYRQAEEPSESLRSYHAVAKIIFKRDKHECQACLMGRAKMRREGLFLTCHHIIPRSDGGTLHADNLITLCNKCHDIVEEKQYRDRTQIFALHTKDKVHYNINEGVTWQQWVYGGRRKPGGIK